MVRRIIKWYMEYSLKERIGGFTVMEIFGPLLVIGIIIGNAE